MDFSLLNLIKSTFTFIRIQGEKGVGCKILSAFLSHQSNQGEEMLSVSKLSKTMGRPLGNGERNYIPRVTSVYKTYKQVNHRFS